MSLQPTQRETNTTRQATGNQRVRSAIAAVRIERNPATMSELYDALNARRNKRNARLTIDERKKLDIEYLRREAPDLLKTIKPCTLCAASFAMGLQFCFACHYNVASD